jgi:hypothetical protein
MAAQPSTILANVQRLHAFMDQLGYAAVVVRSGKILPRCLFHTSTASSPRLSLGAPRSSVASGAGLEPGAPRGGHWCRTYDMDIYEDCRESA